ncbi:MAG: signal peptidase I [Clostridia bacterium]|nr:signal peptidase I [Clostridia bacterium]
MADMELEQKTAEVGKKEPEVKLDKNGKPKKTLKRELLEWVAALAAAVLITFVIRTFIFEPVRVDGDSMYPTLHHGEIMYVSKTSYGTSNIFGKYVTLGGNPERFDVVVCRYPDRGSTNFVKRVVGLPGDTIEIKGGYLYVNGELIPEKFLHERMNYDYGPYTVPEGNYFLMGDNRNNSNDSRSSRVGPVPRDMIVGHVEAVIWHDIPSTLEDANMKD